MKVSTLVKHTILSLIVAVSLLSCSCSGVKLAEKGSVDQGGANVSPKSVVGYVGDVMPFYDDGKMNVFYLQDGRNTNLGFHPYALMTTEDYINYNDYGVVIPYEDDIYSPDFGLGTGSVIKAQDGLYHCFYTGWNGNKNSGLPYIEKIQHATSTDKIHWTKIPEDGFYGGKNDFRDPYVYYSEEDGLYYMLITTRDSVNHGVIKQYSSNDLSKWEYRGIFFKNDKGSYNMECPTFIKYNGYYYLSYSEQGDFRVTHYRYKKNLTDEWQVPEVDYFDGVGFYAARLESDGNDLYAFGWCPTKQGEYDLGEFDWGGNLVTHRLVQNEDGTLSPQMVSSYKTKFSTQVEYKTMDGKPVKEFSFSQNEGKAYAVENLSENVTRMSFTLNAKTLSGDCGLSFDTNANHILGSLAISFDFAGGSVKFYNNVAGYSQMGKAQISVPYNFEAGKDVKIDAIIDGEIITLYVNDAIALSTRMYYMKGAKFSFYSNRTDATFKEIAFYE